MNITTVTDATTSTTAAVASSTNLSNNNFFWNLIDSQDISNIELDHFVDDLSLSNNKYYRKEHLF